MTIEEYSNLFDRGVREVTNDFAQMALASVQDGLALAKLRVLERGEDADGNNFSVYSDAWAKDRASRGRQTEHKDFFDKGDLQASVYGDIDEQGNNTVSVTVRAHGQQNVDKLRGNSNREGGFIFASNKEEIELINDLFLQKIAEKLPT